MKFVMVQFPDATDISTLVVDAAVTVETVAGGTVVMAGTMQNPPTPILPAHSHPIAAEGGVVSIPATTTGPAMPL